MSGGTSLHVATERVASAGQRLATIRGQLAGTGAWLPQTASAADGTDAADACAELARCWQYAVERMADSATELAAAVSAAAECYDIAEASSMQR